MHLFLISCHCPPHPSSALPSHTLGQLLHLIFPFPLLKLSNLRFLLEFSWTQLLSYFPFPHNNWYLCALNSGHPIFPLYFPPSFPPHHTSPFLTCSPPLEAVCCVDCPFKTLVLVTPPEIPWTPGLVFSGLEQTYLPGAVLDQSEAFFSLPCRFSARLCFPRPCSGDAGEVGGRVHLCVLGRGVLFLFNCSYFNVWAFSGLKLCQGCDFCALSFPLS